MKLIDIARQKNFNCVISHNLLVNRRISKRLLSGDDTELWVNVAWDDEYPKLLVINDLDADQVAVLKLGLKLQPVKGNIMPGGKDPGPSIKKPDAVAEKILKRPCSNPRCVLNYAHTGPCLTEGPSAGK
jgi:hypothetical protein